MLVKLFRSDRNDLWYWHVVAKNGRTIAQSQGYKSLRGAVKGVKAVHTSAQSELRIVEVEKC